MVEGAQRVKGLWWARNQLGRLLAIAIGWLMVMVPSQSKRCSGGVRGPPMYSRSVRITTEWSDRSDLSRNDQYTGPKGVLCLELWDLP